MTRLAIFACGALLGASLWGCKPSSQEAATTGSEGSSPATGPVTLNGAGSTFVYPLMSKWSSEYQKVAPNVQVNYQSIGSGGGIRQLIAQHRAVRRDRRADDRRPAQGGARPGPSRSRSRWARSCRPTTCRRSRTRSASPPRRSPASSSAISRRGTTPRSLGKRRPQAARDAHRRGASLRRQRHDLHLGRLPLEGLARLEDEGRQRRPPSTGPSVWAGRATRASPGPSGRRQVRSATSSSPTRCRTRCPSVRSRTRRALCRADDRLRSRQLRPAPCRRSPTTSATRSRTRRARRRGP